MSKNRRVGDINYVFADDQYVLGVNRTYLSHDYYTDIITFDTSDYEGNASIGKVSADIIVSLDTVLADSLTYGVSFSRELYRVMIHGILHVTGNDDLTPGQARLMRQAEDDALSLLSRFQIYDDQIYTPVKK